MSMIMKYFTTDHPECKEDEIYLGNFAPQEAANIGLRTKRRGVKSFCLDGSPYPMQAEHQVFPYFASKAEFDGV